MSTNPNAWRAAGGDLPDIPDGPLIPLRLLVPMLLVWTLGVGGILCLLP